jgi:hypothetical protein
MMFLLLIYGVHCRRHNGTEYSFDALTDMILVYAEAECNNAVTAHPYAKRYLQRQYPNYRTSTSLKRFLRETGYIWPSMILKTLVDHEVSGVLM